MHDLRTLREEKNLSQRQLADQLGISKTAVYRAEKGRGSPDMRYYIHDHLYTERGLSFFQWGLFVGFFIVFLSLIR